MPNSATPKTNPKAPLPVTHARETFAVPRRWLITIPVLIVLPWLVVAMIFFRPAGVAPHAVGTMQGAGGPGGRLTLTPIIISPPMEYVAAKWGRVDDSGVWVFADTTPQQFDQFLASSGLTQDHIGRLKLAARTEPRVRGIVLVPDPAVVRDMTRQTRANVYARLGRNPLNFDQANAFRFHGEAADAWLRGSLISPATRELVEPLIYRHGEFLTFADATYVHTQINDEQELRRLAKTLLRHSTLLVRLSVPDAAEVPALVDYWGKGGRSTDVRPLLESVAGAEDQHRSIDITHLLPAFARNRLYRYPQPTTADEERPALANCLWTALNFFRPTPDDQLLDVQTAVRSLRDDYYIVEGEFELGDIVAFIDDEGDLFHAVVYLANDLVFTKNGTSPVSPWTIMPLADVIGYYHAKAEDPRLIYHRRKDL